jgi:hypothetical protein
MSHPDHITIGGLRSALISATAHHPRPAPTSGRWVACSSCQTQWQENCPTCTGSGVIHVPHEPSSNPQPPSEVRMPATPRRPKKATTPKKTTATTAAAVQQTPTASVDTATSGPVPEKVEDVADWPYLSASGVITTRRCRIWRPRPGHVIAVITETRDDLGTSITNAAEGVRAELEHQFPGEVIEVVEHQIDALGVISYDLVEPNAQGRLRWTSLPRAQLEEKIGTSLAADDEQNPEAVARAQQARVKAARGERFTPEDALVTLMIERLRASGKVPVDDLLAELSPAYQQSIRDAARRDAERRARGEEPVGTSAEEVEARPAAVPAVPAAAAAAPTGVAESGKPQRGGFVAVEWTPSGGSGQEEVLRGQVVAQGKSWAEVLWETGRQERIRFKNYRNQGLRWLTADAAGVEPPAPSVPAPTARKAATPATPMSSEPLIENSWGVGGTEVCFHEDGAIGLALERMGPDRHLEVDGGALANVLGKLASQTVWGNLSPQKLVDEVRQLRDQVPAGSLAQQALTTAVSRMDAPMTEVPTIPDGTPPPLRQLVLDLHSIPLVRRDPAQEMTPLLSILTDLAAGKTPRFGLDHAVQELENRRHESVEGKFTIDAAVARAVEALKKARRK